MRTNRKVFATDADVFKIDWPDAERLLGQRVDRRRSYWKLGNEVFCNCFWGMGGMSPEEIAEVESHRLFPYP
jgi:hypothetical protein